MLRSVGCLHRGVDRLERNNLGQLAQMPRREHPRAWLMAEIGIAALVVKQISPGGQNYGGCEMSADLVISNLVVP